MPMAPSTTRTLHFLQVPWPPHVESMAMPFQLAASNTVVPLGTRVSPSVRASDAVSRKRRRTRPAPVWVPTSSAPSNSICLPGRRRSLLRTVGSDPARAPLVPAEQEVSCPDSLDALQGACVHDRARQPVALCHGQERRTENVPPGKPERRVRGAAGRVHAELVPQQMERLEKRRDGARLG